jgi:hypothetical protein
MGVVAFSIPSIARCFFFDVAYDNIQIDGCT